MIIERLEKIDYEPVSFDLIAAEGGALDAPTVERYIEQWLDRREIEGRCRCTLKHWAAWQNDNQTVHVAVQWLCDKCMDTLFLDLEKEFPNIARLRLGFDPQPDLFLPRVSSIKVKGRPVTFEDGRIEQVGDFEIAAYAVTVDQMRDFWKQTGYLTSGERHGHDDTYLDNPILELVDPGERGSAAADFLSYFDAAEYCAWAGCRLPTEGEYLAAALSDDLVHDGLPEPDVIGELWGSGGIARFGRPVITASRIGNQIVARFGPNVVKLRDWDRFGRNCFLVDQEWPVGVIFPVSRRCVGP